LAALSERSLPVAEEVCRTVLALPLFSAMRFEQVDHVVEQVKRFLVRDGA